MTKQRTLMVVHAHPDDEVFSTGGIIAKYAAQGYRVVVVYGTRGEAGEMHDPDLDPADAIPRLGEIREREVRAAAAILGVTDLYFLGYRDSGMKDSEPNQNPANFMNAPFDEATDRLVAIMRETEPQVMVTYDEEGGYGHPDHVMTHRVTVAAFRRGAAEPGGPRKLYFAARSREGFGRQIAGLKTLGLSIPWIKDDFKIDEYGVPDSEITAHIDIGAYAPLKRHALAVHRTQIQSDFFYLSLPDEAMQQFSNMEYFIRAHPPAQSDEREDDLFAGIEDEEVAA